VIDRNGNKIRDKEVIDYIQRVGIFLLEFLKKLNKAYLCFHSLL